MATNVIMPALGMDQDTGTLVRWIKHEGESVAKGESIMEIETDKVLVEIEANASGMLGNVTAQEGDEIPVGQVIAQIFDLSELPTLDNRLPDAALATPAALPIALAPLPSPPGNTLSPLPTTPSVVAALNGAPQVPAASMVAQPALPPASPLARRLAAERGLEMATLTGSGPDGAVTAADVFAAQVSAAPSTTEGDLAPARATIEGEPFAVGRAWQVMAERMTQSWTTIPQFVLMREVMAAALIDLRTGIRSGVEQRYGVSPTYSDLLVKMVAVALRRHPRLNASWRDGQVYGNTQINVGIATATEDALVVPVIPEADHLSVGEIATRRHDLVERATHGQLTPSDVANGTFTISNLGMYGVDGFNAIVNPPQAAILAVGRIADRVVAVDGQPAVRPTLILTLSCDHRVVDGARAAQFLDELATLIEEPWGLLV
jgi:pyruvate dehydrogenase E2 component (dihydrolipoamide acetyltransferase)